MTAAENLQPTASFLPHVGDELEPQAHTISKLQLLEYTIASRDPNLIHHDPEHARASGLPDIIVQGTLKGGLLARYVEDRLGPDWVVTEFAVQYRGTDIAMIPLIAHGRVAAVQPADGTVDIEVWLESAGQANTRATATVSWRGRPGSARS
jgi:acyl dehydratase